jgi:hypothetical protein
VQVQTKRIASKQKAKANGRLITDLSAEELKTMGPEDL